SGSERKADAQRLLRDREHLVDTGAPSPVHAAKITFDDAAADLLTDYVINKRRSLRTVKLRVTKHLTPYFQHRRLASITPVDVRAAEVRLEVGTTKNGEGRVFPMTRELRRMLEVQQKAAATLRAQDTIVRYVFFYAEGAKAGQRITESGFNKAWRKARIAAG